MAAPRSRPPSSASRAKRHRPATRIAMIDGDADLRTVLLVAGVVMPAPGMRYVRVVAQLAPTQELSGDPVLQGVDAPTRFRHFVAEGDVVSRLAERLPLVTEDGEVVQGIHEVF